MAYWGYHLILDGSRCISTNIRCSTNITNFAKNLVAKIDMVPYGEPRMGKRNLLPSSIEPNDKRRQDIDRMFHLISWADGEHDLISIAEKRNECIGDYLSILQRLIEENLITVK